ncbi:MAG: hypothetical protein JXQ73_27920 [Phycisphaerae bacterium]|nr:hypothetical protein [Phycisphaerae bacterium]
MRLRSLTALGVCVLACVGITGVVGCTGQPLLSDSFGLLPGPSLTLLQEATTGSQVINDLLSGDLSNLTDLINQATSATTTTDPNTTTTTDPNTTTTTETCPEGQVWVGTVTVNGAPLAINQCLDESLARQYGVGG